MRFPTKTLNDLEWSRLLGHWAERCTGEAAAARCLNAPFMESKAAREHLAMVGELMAAIDGGDPPPSLPASSVGDTLVSIEHGGGVSGEALIRVARNLKLFVAIARYVDNRRDAMPRNATLVVPGEGAALLVKLANLAGEIESSFEPDGSVSDRASTELSKLRARVVSLRKHLTSRIEKIAEQEADLLQERTIALRNDRFVLPVRADAHRRLPGIVHGASGSGATVFVEPEAVIEMGNELMLAREAALREEARVIQELAEAVCYEIHEVRAACRVIVDVETRIAAARLSVDLGAVIPTEGEPGTVDLIGARHPLLALAGVSVVPSSLRFGSGQCVVISGPNAGGKTVALKTVGLLGLMLSAGLPIPAAPDSTVAFPLSVLTDIGDDQSLRENLSTFSAHMTNIARILKQAGTGTIVLLDELSAGTDPGEGAALAEAILEHLAESGAATLATTHFATLKIRALGDGPFQNASVGFDMTTMKPTFELFSGTPGASSALAVAERFGAPRRVVDRAKAVMTGDSRRLESAIRALEAERRRLQKERDELSDSLRHAEALEERRLKELAKLKAREERFIDSEREALWNEIRAAREKVREAEQSVKRHRRDAEVVSRSRREINAAAEELSPGGALAAETPSDLPGRPAEASDITEGAKVFVTPFNKAGVVASPLRGGNVFVTVGALKTRVKLADLRIFAAGPKDKAPPKLGAPSLARRQDPIQTGENTLDLRGMTSDEAVDTADAFLDRAMKDDLGVAFIIHGHGTGALKTAIRGYVVDSPYVADSRPGERGEGGDGVTVVWVR